MAHSENLVILVKGQPVTKGTLVDVHWLQKSRRLNGSVQKRRTVSLVHEVGQVEDVAGMIVTARDGKPAAVLTHAVADLRVIKRKD